MKWDETKLSRQRMSMKAIIIRNSGYDGWVHKNSVSRSILQELGVRIYADINTEGVRLRIIRRMRR